MLKKWKMLYLVLAIFWFIIILIPLFQNSAIPSIISFYGNSTKQFTSAYMPIVFMSMIEWALIMLYLQSLFTDYKKQDASKFDLN